MILRNGKEHEKKFKSFYNKQMKFLSKHFVENGKEKLFVNDPSFCKWQNKYYPYNPNLISFCRHTFFFLITNLFVIFVYEEIFFQNCIEMELKMFFTIFEEWLEWEKQKIAIITFKRSLLHADKSFIYYIDKGIIDVAICVNWRA